MKHTLESSYSDHDHMHLAMYKLHQWQIAIEQNHVEESFQKKKKEDFFELLEIL